MHALSLTSSHSTLREQQLYDFLHIFRGVSALAVFVLAGHAVHRGLSTAEGQVRFRLTIAPDQWLLASDQTGRADRSVAKAPLLYHA
jgi:sarcosine oxidase gamma subunit